MGQKTKAIFKCDSCGKEVETKGDIPDGWVFVKVAMTWAAHNFGEYDFCEKCQKDYQLIAVKSASDRFTDPEVHLIKQSDIEALAAGVPAEDIFV